MQVRLTRKLSEAIDGIDLSRRAVGDLLDLSQHDAEMLIAEGWASAVISNGTRPRPRSLGAHAAERSTRLQRGSK